MRARSIVIAVLLISVVMASPSAAAQDFIAGERTWASSADPSLTVIVAVDDPSELDLEADEAVHAVIDSVLDPMRNAGLLDSAIHTERMGDADSDEQLLVTVARPIGDETTAMIGLTAIRSGSFVQLVAVGSTAWSEVELRDRLRALAERVPADAQTADALQFKDVDISAVLGLDLYETTLNDAGTPEAG